MEEKTPVIFRKFGRMNDEIIALFPTIPGTSDIFTCSSYMHTGQHGSANYNLVIQRSSPAKPKEYEELKKELEKIGYDLRVYKKRTWKHIKELLKNMEFDISMETKV